MSPSTKAFEWYTEQRRSLAAVVRRFTTLVVTNWKAGAGVAIGVIAMLALIGGYFIWGARQEAKAAELLFKAVTQLTSNSGSAEDLKTQEEGLRLLREVTSRYPGTVAAAEATLRLGTHFYTLEKYDEAREVYLAYLARNPEGRVAFSAGMGVGDTYQSQGNYEKAVETYSKLISQFPKEPLLPEAYLNLARGYLHIKKEQEAVRLYEKIAQSYPNTGWAQVAQAQIRRLIRR